MKTNFYVILILLFTTQTSIAFVDSLRAFLPEDLATNYSAAVGTDILIQDMKSGSFQLVDKAPWGMPRFAYKTGMLATRHLDANYESLESPQERYAYFKTHGFREILQVSDSIKRQKLINQLSPAEKYDLWIGDLDRTFSTEIWNEVNAQLSRAEVPSWLGLCEGSSSASMRFSQPQKNVKVSSRIPGVEIEFMVGDIKGLLAYMMTTYVSDDLSIFGKRCRLETVDYSTKECFDVNPGAFHQILVQMIKNPAKFPFMILDRTNNSTVWNSALLSASIAYYDPQSSILNSNKAIDHLVNARQYQPPVGSPGWAPGTQKLLYVGTILRVSDTRNTLEFNELGKMSSLDLEIRYILELNNKNEIIGGEWLTPQYPDFLWQLPRDYRPQAYGDRETEFYEWDGVDFPEEVRPLILESSKRAQPLFKLIDYIYKKSI